MIDKLVKLVFALRGHPYGHHPHVYGKRKKWKGRKYGYGYGPGHHPHGWPGHGPQDGWGGGPYGGPPPYDPRHYGPPPGYGPYPHYRSRGIKGMIFDAILRRLMRR